MKCNSFDVNAYATDLYAKSKFMKQDKLSLKHMTEKIRKYEMTLLQLCLNFKINYCRTTKLSEHFLWNIVSGNFKIASYYGIKKQC